jgi:hypothetical protein
MMFALSLTSSFNLCNTEPIKLWWPGLFAMQSGAGASALEL